MQPEPLESLIPLSRAKSTQRHYPSVDAFLQARYAERISENDRVYKEQFAEELNKVLRQQWQSDADKAKIWLDSLYQQFNDGLNQGKYAVNIYLGDRSVIESSDDLALMDTVVSYFKDILHRREYAYYDHVNKEKYDKWGDHARVYRYAFSVWLQS